ncbi:MAG: hypothetical protein GQ564_15245 [Bacteroidales bacterium]|nr:hypothetical protein [Bacteroidales bacterium]
MKKSIILCTIILAFFTIKSQNTFICPLLLLPLEEHTVIKINETESELDSILIYHRTEQIEIRKGKLNLVDSYGNEIILEAGEKIKIKESINQNEVISQAISLNRISKFINSPSIYLPNLYNNERNNFTIFPLESKVNNKANIKFYISPAIVSEMKLNIYLQDSDSIIWQKKGYANDFSFHDAPFESGKSYSWRLYSGSNSIKGNFELLSEDQIQRDDIDKILTKIEYLSRFFNFLENECKFEALKTLIIARNQYPQSEIFKKLINKFPIDIN